MELKTIMPENRPLNTPCCTKATGRQSIGQTVSRAVTHYRRLRRLSQTELAARAQISRNRLNAIESGLGNGLRVSTLVCLASALGIRPDQMLGWAPLD